MAKVKPYTPEFIEEASDQEIWKEFNELCYSKNFQDYASGDHSLETTKLLREELIAAGIPYCLTDTQGRLNKFVTRVANSELNH